MKFFRALAALILCAALGIALSACGGGSGTDPNPSLPNGQQIDFRVLSQGFASLTAPTATAVISARDQVGYNTLWSQFAPSPAINQPPINVLTEAAAGVFYPMSGGCDKVLIDSVVDIGTAIEVRHHPRTSPAGEVCPAVAFRPAVVIAFTHRNLPVVGRQINCPGNCSRNNP